MNVAKARAILSSADFQRLTALRARQTELEKDLSVTIPKIDLSLYQKTLSSPQASSVLNDVTTELSNFKVHKGDVSAVLKDLELQEQEALKEAAATVDLVSQTVATFKNDLAAIDNLADHDRLDVHAVYKAAPGLEKKYHQQLRDGKPFHDNHDFGERFLG